MLLLTTDVVNDDDYDATEIGYSIVWWFINKVNYGCLLSMLMTIVYDNWDTNHRLPKALPDMEIINGACIFH